MDDNRIRQAVIGEIDKAFGGLPSSLSPVQIQQKFLLMSQNLDVTVFSASASMLAQRNRYAGLFGCRLPRRELRGDIDRCIDPSVAYHPSIMERDPLLALIEYRFLVNPSLNFDHRTDPGSDDLKCIYDLSDPAEARQAAQWYGDLTAWPVIGRSDPVLKLRGNNLSLWIAMMAETSNAYGEIVNVVRHSRKNTLIQNLLDKCYVIDASATEEDETLTNEEAVFLYQPDHATLIRIQPMLNNKSNDLLLRVTLSIGDGLAITDIDMLDTGALWISDFSENIHDFALELEQRIHEGDDTGQTMGM